MEYRLRLVCFVTNCMYCSQDNREFTHVRQQRQDDGYQYNIINPIAQNKRIIKSISGEWSFRRRPGSVDEGKMYIFTSCKVR